MGADTEEGVAASLAIRDARISKSKEWDSGFKIKELGFRKCRGTTLLCPFDDKAPTTKTQRTQRFTKKSESNYGDAERQRKGKTLTKILRI